MAESDKKSMNELRVVDLKYELEKRKIDTTGNKAVLLKKLHKALMNEDLDPEEHLFDIEVDSRGSPMRKKKTLEEPEIKKEAGDCFKEEIKREDAEVKEVKNVQEKVEGNQPKPEGGLHNDQTLAEKIEAKGSEKVIKEEREVTKNIPIEAGSKSMKPDDKGSDEESTTKKDEATVKEENVENKPDQLVDSEAEQGSMEKVTSEAVNDDPGKEAEKKFEVAVPNVKKEEEDEIDELEVLLDDKEEEEGVEENGNKDVDDDDVLKLEDKSDVNGMDAEDSIHLMIGEDEEKLMAGEDDPVEKRKDVKEDRSRRGGKGQDSRKNDGRSISPENSADDKGKKSNYRNLWVSNLASMTRAQDLKQIFSKLGKVVAAKVVTSAKTPGARCYGFVTMATADDAQACIKGLNMTELHGRLISVEAVASKPASANPTKKPEEKGKLVEPTQSIDRKRRREDSEGKIDELTGEIEEKKGDASDKQSVGGDDVSPKKDEDEKEGKEGDDSDKGGHSGSSPPRRSRPHVRERLGERPMATARRTNNRERIAIRTGRQDVLSFAKIKEERERQRLREKERAQREDERRRRDEMDRQRIIERRQKEELIRLEREREKVRVERLKLQKEKEDFLRLERERLAREREDLKRAQLKLEEEKRAKRAARELYEERSKRTIESSRRYEHSGPPPRKEPRRESPPSPPPTSRARYVEPRSSSRTRRIEPPPPRVKDSVRYPERSGPPSSATAFRSGRDDRRDRERERDRDDHHRKTESSRVHRDERYDVPPPKGGDMRYGSESWVGSSSKPYSSSGGGSNRPDNGSWMVPERKSDAHPWARNQPPQSDRWAGPGGNSLPGTSSRSAMYGGIGMSIGGSLGLSNVVPNMYPPTDRYDAYKTSSGSMGRKY